MNPSISIIYIYNKIRQIVLMLIVYLLHPPWSHSLYCIMFDIG